MVPTSPQRTAISPLFMAAELAGWRRRLVALRDRAADDLDQLADEAGDDQPAPAGRDASAAGQSRDAMALASLNDQELVEAIDLALQRIDTGQPLPFGLCLVTRKPIERQRLELMPWTPVSVRGAAEREAGKVGR